MSADLKVWCTLNLSAARVDQIGDLFEVYGGMAVVSDFFPLIKAALLRRGLSEKPQWPPLQCVILAAVTI